MGITGYPRYNGGMRALLVLMLTLCTCLGMAQFDMNPLAMQTRPAMLMIRNDVKKDLKLSGEQNKAIAKIESDMQKAVTSAGRSNDLGAMGGSIKAMKDADEAVLAVLDESQRTRFTQIRIQVIGGATLLDPDLSKPLSLTDEQRSKAKELQDAHFQKVMDEMQHHHDRNLKKRLDKMRDEHDQAMIGLLTDEQKAKFKAMQGPVFKGARDFGMGF